MSVTDFGLRTGHIVSFRSSRIRLLFFVSVVHSPTPTSRYILQ